MTTPAVEGAGERSETSGIEGGARRSVLFGELHLRLLEEYGPPSVLVNEAYQIVHLSEHAGRYLTFRAGEPSTNLMTVVHPALRVELRTALFRAAQGNHSVIVPARELEIGGQKETIDLQVRPMRPADSAHGFFLVLFEKKTEPLDPAAEAAERETVSHALGDELQALKGQLNSTIEQYEASAEELKASNEELQAMNEELRSAAEELETSKEELQSVNEELTTVNLELKEKVEEVSRANSDLNNLMRSTDLATIFLDRHLRVLRFTPRVQELFNLLPADTGRPISDITNKLRYETLLADAEQVLEGLVPLERAIETADDRSYLARIAPYRTLDDKISGVVLTLIDVTQINRAQAEVRAISQQLEIQAHRFDTIMDAVPDFVYEFDLEGRFTYVNPSLLALWGVTAEQAVGKNFHQLEYTPELATKLQRQIQEVIATRHPLKDETPYTSEIGERMYEYLFFPLFGEEGKVEAVAGVTRDITERRRAELALRQSEERFRQFAENSADVFWIIDTEQGQIDYLNPVYEKVYGESRDALRADIAHFRELVHPEDRARSASALPRLLEGEHITIEYRIVRPSDGETRWIRDTGFPIRDGAGRITRVAGVAQDITDGKKDEETLRLAEERFRLLVEGARDYAMFLLDPQNIITFWSKGAERVFGWTQEEAVGQGGDLIFIPEDKARGEVEKEITTALEQGRAPDRRFHLRKDRSRFWADGVLMRLDGGEGVRGFAKVARDASDQRAIEDALRQAKDELEQRVLERTRDLVATNNELERTMAQRQQLEKELLEISEREKRRIGEDLHDMVCQELTATALFLKSSANQLAAESPAAAATLNESAQIVNRNVGAARDLARGLQPAELKAADLKDALRALAAQACEASDMKCHFKAARGVRVIDDMIALHLYRVAQEAVKNAVKHSGAKNVLISLDRNEHNVCVSVSDDGHGFSPKRKTKGLGLHIMRYRANALGGELKIKSRRSGGTEITCVFPIKR